MNSAPADSAPAQKRALPELPRDLVRANFTKLPNAVFDSTLLHVLNGTARYLYLDFLRMSIGHDRGQPKISRTGLIRRTGFSETAIASALKALAAAGLVVPIERDQSSSVNQDRGTRYQVYVPHESLEPAPSESAGARRAGARSGDMKEREKDKYIKTPVAVAPAVDVFGIRTVAARIFEAHRGEPDFDQERLRALVLAALVGQGSDVPRELVDEAIRGMAVGPA